MCEYYGLTVAEMYIVKCIIHLLHQHEAIVSYKSITLHHCDYIILTRIGNEHYEHYGMSLYSSNCIGMCMVKCNIHPLYNDNTIGLV